ncbi:DUF2955 domain-containing protein [Photobacterium sanguinicancri]|uniref:DUF2955 domain-containing protein n=1 Tax=Photobacterium sanguinicancri TaxID=875932 RepID=UPI0026E41FA9|nr:DUF2955 domain-containing protein [Photobacterium sanguinicancri]MDO6498034.1 DUF2955 domain-containing protein [Photobacterium sanguinicancri]
MINIDKNEALRVTLTITLCMLAGKILGLNSPVYLALYPTIVMTKGKDYSWCGLVKMLFPTLISASCALIVTELFHDHPFIIWTVSLIFFDQMRRRANTQAKLGGMLMPTFNWILIIVFSQHTTADMPMRIHEILISMTITILMTKSMVTLFPKPKYSPAPNGKPPALMPQNVTYQNRFVSLGLIGGGLAFLMIVDLISATFCMVPVIAAATQFNREQFYQVVKRRLITQVGGCAIAVVFSLFIAGHQDTISYYALGLGGLVYIIAFSMAQSQGISRDIHADSLLATMLPIQLYMTSTTLGLESTYLRAWELAITLGILFILHQLTRSRDHHDQKHYSHS